jgi:hypothetical protein
MKMIWKLGLVFFTAFLISACFNPPEYPDIPEIIFKNLKFISGKAAAGNQLATPDTLKLSIDFKDGDGNFGLSDAEIGQGEFTERYYFKINDLNTKYYLSDPSQLVTLAKDQTFIRYKTKRTNPNYYSLPNFDCINWQTVDEQVGSDRHRLDTMYCQMNPNYYNFFVDFLIQQSDGTFAEYDIVKELCSTPFDGRVPILSKDLNNSIPLEGTISYSMKSSGFKLFIGNRQFRLRIQIQDRLFNKSNLIETQDFTLNSIK